MRLPNHASPEAAWILARSDALENLFKRTMENAGDEGLPTRKREWIVLR